MTVGLSISVVRHAMHVRGVVQGVVGGVGLVIVVVDTANVLACHIPLMVTRLVLLVSEVVLGDVGLKTSKLASFAGSYLQFFWLFRELLHHLSLFFENLLAVTCSLG